MDQNEYTIARASLKDADWIARLQMAMAEETEHLILDQHTVERGVERLFEEPRRGFYLVARHNTHTPVGCLLVLKEWSDWRNADVWWIHSVYITPAHRCQGLFKRMFGAWKMRPANRE